DKEERQLGEQVSLQLRNRFGVYQDAKITKYVALVGTAISQASSRPALDWQFIVLDTDGVNAYAAPGGFIHITRGLLGLMKNEAELAGVLGHEITHVTEKHTVNAIKREKGVTMGGEAFGSAGGLTQEAISRLGAGVFNKVFRGECSQADENESDKIGARMADKVGYSPNGIAEVLKRIQARNADRQDRNGMFASHSSMKERIEDKEKTHK